MSDYPTDEDLKAAKLAMDDINGFTYSTDENIVDANGITRLTFTGVLEKLGYLVPIAYASGIVFTAFENTKTIEVDGKTYAPHPSSLPFTTSGTFTGDDDSNFYLVPLSLSDLTPEIVGLGNVDNTSDIDKPISTLTQDALDSLSKDYNTLAEAVADIDKMVAGDIVDVKERTSGKNGGAKWEVVDSTTVTEDEYSIVTGNATLSLVLLVQNSIDPAAFGCDGTDDAGAFEAVMIYSDANKLPVTGPAELTIDVSGLTKLQLAYIHLDGGFTISGSATDSLFLPLDILILNGVTFKDIGVVIENNWTDVVRVNLTKFFVTKCTFDTVSTCANVQEDGTSSASDYAGENLQIHNNIISNCGSGFTISIVMTNWSCTGNSFVDLGNAALSTATDAVIGLSIGADTQTDDVLYANQGNGSMSSNSLNGLTSTRTGAHNFLRVFGRNISVTGNTGFGMYHATSSNCEGIYVKGNGVVVSNNTLVDCGDNEASIKLKSRSSDYSYTSPDGRIPNEENIVSGNIIRWTAAHTKSRKGIATTVGRISIIGNRIDNCNNDAIVASDSGIDGQAENLIISNNVITKLTCDGSGIGRGVQVYGTKQAIITNNVIELYGSAVGTLYGISGYGHNSFIGESCVISGNLISLEAATDTGGGSGTFRGVYLNLSQTYTIKDVRIKDNTMLIHSSTRTVYGIHLTGTTVAEHLEITDNNNGRVSSISGSAAPLSIGSTSFPTELLKIEGNGDDTKDTSKATSADFSLLTSDVNFIVYKKEGVMKFDISTNKPVFASGSLSSSTWLFADGTLAYTPI